MVTTKVLQSNAAIEFHIMLCRTPLFQQRQRQSQHDQSSSQGHNHHHDHHHRRGSTSSQVITPSASLQHIPNCSALTAASSSSASTLPSNRHRRENAPNPNVVPRGRSRSVGMIRNINLKCCQIVPRWVIRWVLSYNCVNHVSWLPLYVAVGCMFTQLRVHLT